MKEIVKHIITADNWESLRAFTGARIALGRVGVSIPLRESLHFRLAHAHAKDAVFSVLDSTKLHRELTALGLRFLDVHSQATDRAVYLQRPDLGRLLDDNSFALLEKTALPDFDVAIVISDGLSATAVNENAVPLLQYLLPLFRNGNYTIAPIVLASQARVAIADPIGYLLKARLTLNLIGERPGLSSFDSLGAYLTFDPKTGLTDERRNCISNIRPQGLKVEMAARKIFYLVEQAFELHTSGVLLKDNDNKGLIK